MSSQQLSTFRVQFDFFRRTDIDLSEIILVEISALQNISALKNLLSFQFRFCSEYKPGSVQALFLFGNGFCFSFVFCNQCFFSCGQVADSSVQFLNTDILGSQFCLKLLDTLLFSVQFGSQSGNSFFHLCRIVTAIL